MSVSLNKDDIQAKAQAQTPIREYTPVHILDESETMPKTMPKTMPDQAVISEKTPKGPAALEKIGTRPETDLDLKIAEEQAVKNYLKDDPEAAKRVANRIASGHLIGVLPLYTAAVAILILAMLIHIIGVPEEITDSLGMSSETLSTVGITMAMALSTIAVFKSIRNLMR